MKESDLWRYLREGMKGKHFQATRIESSAGNGVPDVAFTIPTKHGWIELKYIKEWPKRPTTLVKLPLRPEQKQWIESRGKLADNVWVICRIADIFYILDHKEAVMLCEGGTRDMWEVLCTRSWSKRIDFDNLWEILRWE